MNGKRRGAQPPPPYFADMHNLGHELEMTEAPEGDVNVTSTRTGLLSTTTGLTLLSIGAFALIALALLAAHWWKSVARRRNRERLEREASDYVAALPTAMRDNVTSRHVYVLLTAAVAVESATLPPATVRCCKWLAASALAPHKVHFCLLSESSDPPVGDDLEGTSPHAQRVEALRSELQEWPVIVEARRTLPKPDARDRAVALCVSHSVQSMVTRVEALWDAAIIEEVSANEDAVHTGLPWADEKVPRPNFFFFDTRRSDGALFLRARTFRRTPNGRVTQRNIFCYVGFCYTPLATLAHLCSSSTRTVRRLMEDAERLSHEERRHQQRAHVMLRPVLYTYSLSNFAHALRSVSPMAFEGNVRRSVNHAKGPYCVSAAYRLGIEPHVYDEAKMRRDDATTATATATASRVMRERYGNVLRTHLRRAAADQKRDEDRLFIFDKNKRRSAAK
jgi:hypothetical protein